MRRAVVQSVAIVTVLVMAAGSGIAQPDDRTRSFNVPAERVWMVTRSTLKSMGWDVDKEDRDVGWIRTDSRRLEGGEYGVYSKGAKHRLRVVIKPLDANRTSVSVERRVWKEERILWMDKEEDIPTTDHSVERQVLDALAKSL